MNGRNCSMKRYLLSLWRKLDPLYFHCTRLRYIPENEKQNTVFRARVTRYKGITTVLDDGTKISKNDLLLKIHFHNVRILTELFSVQSEVKRAVYLYHTVKSSMPRLAKFVAEQEDYHDIKAIIGITSLSRGVHRFGFKVVPIKNAYYRIFKQCTFLPINFLAKTSSSQTPVYVFMSKKQLIDLYAKQSDG